MGFKGEMEAAEEVPLVGVVVGEQHRVAQTTLAIEGMTCGACTAAIEGGFENLEGIESFTVSLMTERAVAVHDLLKLSAQDVADVIENRGFGAEVISSNVQGENKATLKMMPSLATTTVAVDGMTCGACTAAVEEGFKGVQGVSSFTVSLMTERAVVVYDPNLLSTERIAEIIEGRGFGADVLSTTLPDTKERDVRIDTVIFKIFGLNSEDDSARLETALRSSPGISDAVITLSNARAKIDFLPAIIGVRDLVEIVEAQNLNALLADTDENNAQLESLAKTKEIQEWRTAFRTSFLFAVPVFVIGMILPMWFKGINQYLEQELFCSGLYLNDVICLALTAPVQFGVGKRFYKSAWKNIRHGSTTMDVLVVLGTSAAFFFSLVAMIISIIFPPHNKPNTVFDTSTMLITFITLGRYLENKAKGQTSKALSRLMSLAPSMATIYVDSDQARVHSNSEDATPIEEKMIPTELLQVGDVVILRPGDKIAADGVVLVGETYIDESMVTGEAMPILKRKGDFLMGGTVNGAGRIDFRVTRAGRDTQLSQIVKLVQDAQTSRAPIQRMADIVAGWFVPGVLTLALITFVGWMILSHVLQNPPQIFLEDNSGGKFMVCLKLCISVIVFACPCALGLSTPTAVMVGTGVGAENGILVKGGAALEMATRVTQVVLDKTGTLTQGKMSVAMYRQSGIWHTNKMRKSVWWLLIGATESGSEHPVGRAIGSAARKELGVPPDGVLDATIQDFRAVVGRGVEAFVRPSNQLDGKVYRVLVGNAKYLAESNIPIAEDAILQAKSENSREIGEEGKSKGRTFVFVAIEGVYAGLIALSDEIKPDAVHAVDALRRLNVKVAMVTGDQEATALAVASEVGIDASDVWASVSPNEKQDIVKLMQSNGEIIAMVGDGINDSPALATADVGIAMASGTDVAMEAADVVLMRPHQLLDVPAALCLARTIFKRIKMNLWWACAYNIIGLPFAMGFFLPLGLHLHPMAAGAAMAASSVSVVCSSLMLRFWKRPRWMNVQAFEEESTGWKLRFMDHRKSFRGKLHSIFRRRESEAVKYQLLNTSADEQI